MKFTNIGASSARTGPERYLNQQSSKPGKLVFESEQFENFDNNWRASETYEVSSTDEFVEIFELAPPGKSFPVYSRTHFKRVKK